MNRLFWTLIFVALSFAGNSQVMAVTEKGDTIYVYDNGTWSYTIDEAPEYDVNELAFLEKEILIDTIEGIFISNKKNAKTVKSTLDHIQLKYDDKTWKRIPAGQINEDAEFAFQSTKNDIYALVITEASEIGTENIFKIALNMMEENTGATTNVVKAEMRNINGIDVLRGVFEVSLNGMNFIFDSYYHSNENGTIQYSTWCSPNIHEKNQAEIEGLLNGLFISN